MKKLSSGVFLLLVLLAEPPAQHEGNNLREHKPGHPQPQGDAWRRPLQMRLAELLGEEARQVQSAVKRQYHHRQTVGVVSQFLQPGVRSLAHEGQPETIHAKRQQPSQKQIRIRQLQEIAEIIEARVLEFLEIRMQRKQASQERQCKMDFRLGELGQAVVSSIGHRPSPS